MSLFCCLFEAGVCTLPAGVRICARTGREEEEVEEEVETNKAAHPWPRIFPSIPGHPPGHPIGIPPPPLPPAPPPLTLKQPGISKNLQESLRCWRKGGRGGGGILEIMTAGVVGVDSINNATVFHAGEGEEDEEVGEKNVEEKKTMPIIDDCKQSIIKFIDH